MPAHALSMVLFGSIVELKTGGVLFDLGIEKFCQDRGEHNMFSWSYGNNDNNIRSGDKSLLASL